MLTATMRPRQIQQPGGRMIPDTVIRENKNFPNLMIVQTVGRFGPGEVVSKKDFPNGFLDHLRMGVVRETNRPVTTETTEGRKALEIEDASGEYSTAHKGRMAVLEQEMLDATKQNNDLAKQIAVLQAQVNGLTHQRDELEVKNAKLSEELNSAEQLLSQATAPTAKPEPKATQPAGK